MKSRKFPIWQRKIQHSPLYPSKVLRAKSWQTSIVYFTASCTQFWKISILAGFMVPNLQKRFLWTIWKKTITMLNIKSRKLSFMKISKFSFTENFWSETKILSHIFGKNFVKVTVLQNDLTKYFFGEREFLCFQMDDSWKKYSVNSRNIFFDVS